MKMNEHVAGTCKICNADSVCGVSFYTNGKSVLFECRECNPDDYYSCLVDWKSGIRENLERKSQFHFIHHSRSTPCFPTTR